MTRRERLEARAERRREWADKATARSASRFGAARAATEGIPFGQPILVGHHSEGRHRAALARSDSNMRKACEESDKAAHHSGAAAGIERALEVSIYSDDPDAIEALEAKAANLERERDRMKEINAAWKKAGKPKPTPPDDGFEEREKNRAAWQSIADAVGMSDNDLMQVRKHMPFSWHPAPFPPYALTNIGATIRTARKRIEDVKRRTARHARAEGAGGVLIERPEPGVLGWCRVTFDEKPERSVIEALKAAGFMWGAGSWSGPCEKLPACVLDLEADAAMDVLEGERMEGVGE